MASILISSSGIILPSGNTWVQQTGNGININATNLTIKAADVESGTDLNGGTLTLRSGKGTGTGSSTISFSTGDTLTTGGTLQTISVKMTILGNGRVGIGTVNPSQKLHIAGTTTNDYAQLDVGLKFSVVTRPPEFSVAQVTTSVGNIPNGTYWYYISYITDLGETELTGDGGLSEFLGNYGEPGPAGIVVDATHKKVDVSVTASTDYRVTGIKIYRSASGSFYTAYLVDTISNVTQTYTDNVASTSGGNVIVRENTTHKQIYMNSTRAMFLGDSNTQFGVGAGAYITTGGNNTLLGAACGNLISSAGSNVLIGFYVAPFYNLGSSIGIGQWALYLSQGVLNVAIGGNCLFYGGGNYNTAIGHSAGFSNSAGNNNVYIGYQCGYLSTGGSNIFIGYYAGAKETTENNLLIIGNQAYADKATEQQNSIIYGVMASTLSNQSLYINANDIRFGTSASLYLKVESTGDTYWVGSGAGLPFGSCWGNEIGWTQASAAQNTWYLISDTDVSDGQLNLVTHDGNGKLTVTKAGKYLVNWAVTESVSIAGKHVQVGIAVDGSVVNDGINHVDLNLANSEIPVSNTAILNLAANATVELAIRTTDTGTPDLSIDHYNLSVVMVGA
jgi:hypothetical protein